MYLSIKSVLKQNKNAYYKTDDLTLTWPRSFLLDGGNEADSDSAVDFSYSPASPSASEASSYSSSSSSSSCVSTERSLFSEDEDEDAEYVLVDSDMEVKVTIKQERLEEEEMGAVGGRDPGDVKKPFLLDYGDDKLFNGFPWLEHIGHDHTYNQPWSPPSSPFLGKMPTKQTKSSPQHDNVKPYHRSSSRHSLSETKMQSRDERRARGLKVPFSNELIVNLPVEEFNDLLASCQLSEDQLSLVRDIRRRGKNKIAAQNCRKRKMNVLVSLSDDVSGLRRYRSRLLREKQEALRKLQEMKSQVGMLYQEVFSRLRDEEGRPLDAMEYLLDFEPNGSVTVASRQQGPLTKNNKKQRDKKKWGGGLTIKKRREILNRRVIKTTKKMENTDALVDEGAQEFFILCNGTMNSSPLPWEEWSTKMMSKISTLEKDLSHVTLKQLGGKLRLI